MDVHRLEEKYRDLIEHSPEMIYQLNRSGRFVHVNKTGLEKLKYTLDEMLSMRLWELVPRRSGATRLAVSGAIGGRRAQFDGDGVSG